MANSVLLGAGLFVLGAVAGFGVAVLLPSASSNSDGTNEISRGASHRESPRDAGSSGGDAPALSDDKESAASSAREESAAPSSRVDVVSTPLSRPTGDGVIVGDILDDKGVAIAGALVRATYSVDRDEAQESRIGRVQSDRSLDDELKRARDEYQKQHAVRVEATSDANGHFALNGLGDGYWTVSATADGYVVRARGTVANLKPGATAKFEGRAVIEVPLAVYLPDGRAAQRVNISVQSDSPRAYENVLWTAKDPVLRLAPGSHEIRAIVTRAQRAANGIEDEAASKKTRLDFVAGETPAQLELHLEPRIGIRGIAYFGDGIELEQGCATYLQVPKGAPVDSKQFESSEPKDWLGQNENRFEFLDLAAGTYAVAILASWNGPVLKHQMIELTKGIVECEIDLRDLDKKSFLSIKVVGPKNEPVTVTNFTYMFRSEQMGTSGWIQPIVAAPGEYLVPPDENISAWKKSDSAGSTLVMTVHSDRFGEKNVTLNRADAQTLVKFGEVGSLDVTVAGYLGSGLEGQVDVELKRADATNDNYFYSNDLKLKGDGTAHFGPTEVGNYVLKLVSLAGNRWNRRTVATQKLTIVTGDNSASINLPALYTVSVTIEGGGANQAGWINLSGNEIYDNAQIHDGKAEFKNLAAGEYRIDYDMGSLSANVSINVPDQLQVTLTPKEPNAMRVNIFTADGYLGKIGIQSGDVIVGFDGQPFKDQQAMQAAFATAIARPKVTLNIVRGSNHLDCEVDGQKLLDPQSIGASWQPVAH